MPQRTPARKGRGTTRTLRVTRRTVQGASRTRRLCAALVRHPGRAPAVTPLGRGSRRWDHPELPRGIIGQRLAQIIGQPGDTTLGRHDVPRKRGRHTGERRRRRSRPLLPVAELAVRIAKPQLELRRSTRELLRARLKSAPPPLHTPRHCQRERRHYHRQNREPTRRIDGIPRGRGRAGLHPPAYTRDTAKIARGLRSGVRVVYARGQGRTATGTVTEFGIQISELSETKRGAAFGS